MIKKRCIRCRQYLRPDGTCQNPNCVRYVPETNDDGENEQNANIEQDKEVE
jgi:hypothetical protein